MKIVTMTVIPADRFVAINGEGYFCDVEIPAHSNYGAVHAIQWGEHGGQMEHGRGPTIGFAEFEKIVPFVSIWTKARAIATRAHHAEMVRNNVHIDAAVKAQTSAVAAMTADIRDIDRHLKGASAHDPHNDAWRNAKTVTANHLEQASAQLDVLIAQKAALDHEIGTADARAKAAERDINEQGQPNNKVGV